MVKIYEVTELKKADDELPFDLVDDTTFYMRNDPQFYRKEYFPVMSKLADMHREGKQIDHRKHIGPMVEKGINQYCAKFDLAKSPEEVFNQQHRDELIDKLFREEVEEIEKGEYK